VMFAPDGCTVSVMRKCPPHLVIHVANAENSNAVVCALMVGGVYIYIYICVYVFD
jgi:hypothetical protein